MLVEDSLLLEKWQYPEYVIKTHISVFSVKNPDEVLNNSIPEVKLIGPYVFDKKIRRVVGAFLITFPTYLLEKVLYNFIHMHLKCCKL